MTKENQIKLIKARCEILQGRGEKNIKSGGVLRKLKRQIRNLEK